MQYLIKCDKTLVKIGKGVRHNDLIIMFLVCYMFGNSSSYRNWWSV